MTKPVKVEIRITDEGAIHRSVYWPRAKDEVNPEPIEDDTSEYPKGTVTLEDLMEYVKKKRDIKPKESP